ncbi:MAG: hypothetical protein ACR2O4_18265, partial [Hyphomicrobiaceae bacterium]
MHTFVKSIAVALLSFTISAASAPPAPAAPDIFQEMAGKWRGWGDVLLNTGQTERVRCHASYALTAAGRNLSQSLKCAGAGYTFNVTASLRANGQSLQGQFSESTNGLSGSISGRANGSNLDLTVVGSGFTASMSM